MIRVVLDHSLSFNTIDFLRIDLEIGQRVLKFSHSGIGNLCTLNEKNTQALDFLECHHPRISDIGPCNTFNNWFFNSADSLNPASLITHAIASWSDSNQRNRLILSAPCADINSSSDRAITQTRGKF